jgi:hypothetical protein
VDLHDDLGDVAGAARQVDAAAAQAGQLAHAQAAVGAEQDQGSVAGADGIGRRATSAGFRKRISSRSILGRRIARHGERGIMSALTAAVRVRPSSWSALTTVAGANPRADSWATQACTSGWVIAASGVVPKRGSTRELR